MMIKYKKSLYYASFAVYGTGAVVWPILYLNNQNAAYLLAEVLFVIMLIKEIKDYRWSYQNSDSE